MWMHINEASEWEEEQVETVPDVEWVSPYSFPITPILGIPTWTSVEVKQRGTQSQKSKEGQTSQAMQNFCKRRGSVGTPKRRQMGRTIPPVVPVRLGSPKL